MPLAIKIVLTVIAAWFTLLGKGFTEEPKDSKERTPALLNAIVVILAFGGLALLWWLWF